MSKYPYTKIVRMNAAQWKQLHELAAAWDCSASEVVRRVLHLTWEDYQQHPQTVIDRLRGISHPDAP